jgi:hypothetical protein
MVAIENPLGGFSICGVNMTVAIENPLGEDMTDSAAERPVIEADVARPAEAKRTVSRGERARRSGYRTRFAAIYLALAAVAGVGIGAFLVLEARPDAGPAQQWSAWAPDGSETAKVRQIADHVSKHYRVGSNQLAVALAGPPRVTSAEGEAIQVPISAVAVLPNTATGQQEEGDVDIVDTSKTLQVSLCGLGEACSIPFGEPSEARHALLRREALELALYTFHYVKGIDSIVVLLPPALPAEQGGDLTSTAVYLDRGNVSRELGRPLTRTLGATIPAVGEMPDAELATVNRVTLPRTYTYAFRQAQDGSAVMLLSPVVA